MKTIITTNSVTTAKKAVASITRLTRKASTKSVSFNEYEAKVDKNLGLMMDEAMKTMRIVDNTELYKLLGRI